MRLGVCLQTTAVWAIVHPDGTRESHPYNLRSNRNKTNNGFSVADRLKNHYSFGAKVIPLVGCPSSRNAGQNGTISWGIFLLR